MLALLYLVNFFQPPLDTLKGPFVSDIVNEEDALSPSGIRSDDSAESALTTCVPELELDTLSVDEYDGLLEC